jgi:hypothetical protein
MLYHESANLEGERVGTIHVNLEFFSSGYLLTDDLNT